jgi:drug/metabolite transporter (DMT)-like permease
MRAVEYVLLTVLAAMWGLSFAFYRIAVPFLGPAVFAWMRVALAGSLLLGYLAISRQATPALGRVRAHWKDYLILGGLNAALPFTLIGFGELVLPASYASVLNATTPLFTLLIAAAWVGQAIRAPQLAGIVLGMIGVAIVVGAAPFPLTMSVLLAVAAATVAAASYGVAAVYVRRKMTGVSTVDLSLGQLLGASLLLLPLAGYEAPRATFPFIALVSVVGIATLCTVLAYVIYFRILQTVGATQAVSVTFLMPVFGVIWGHVLLGEPVGWALVAGFAIIIIGILLVTSLPRPHLVPGPEPTR